MVIRGVASSSWEGLRREGPGTVAAARKPRRRDQSLPHIFLGRSRPARPPAEARARGTGVWEKQSQGSKFRYVRWKVRGHEAMGVKHLWGQGGSWNGGDMEPQSRMAMESQLRGQGEGSVTCLSASNANSTVNWEMNSHRGLLSPR